MEQALFLLVPDPDTVRGPSALGTGFAVASGSFVITAKHVVSTQERWILLNPTSANLIHASVASIDPDHDLALLRPDQDLSAGFEVAEDEAMPPGTGVIVWDWPDEANVLGRSLRPQCHSGLAVGVAARRGVVGYARHGMSGGPVVLPDSHLVTGVLVGMRAQVDPQEVLDTWWGKVQGDWHLDKPEVDLLLTGLADQLALTYAITESASAVRALLLREQPG